MSFSSRFWNGLPVAPLHPVKKFLIRSVALTIAGVFGLQPTLMSVANAQQIVDPHAPIQFRPSIGVSSNGTPTINIVTPSFGGVSHNKFQQYNVDTRGVILNNSGLGGTSVIGGQVGANPNLIGHSAASTIINETTSNSPSVLNGPTEVFGSTANVIIANPNGITCSSCQFINAGKVTLSTGVPAPNYTTGAIVFNTAQGTILVNGGGIAGGNGQTLGDIDLIGRQLSIQGPVQAAGTVRLVAGANSFDQQAGVTSALPPGTSMASVSGPAVFSSASGTITAGTISVLSTDANLGVTLNGSLNSLSGPISIQSAGNVAVTGGTHSNFDFDVTAAGDVLLTNNNQAVGRIVVSGSNVTIDSAGTLAANDNVIVSAIQSLVSNGTIVSGANISLTSQGSLVASGRIGANGQVILQANAINTNNLGLSGSNVQIIGLTSANIDQTGIASKGDIRIIAPNLELGQGTGFSANGTIYVDATNTLTNATILNYPNLQLSVRNNYVSTSTGALQADNLILTVTDTIDNAGQIAGNLSLALSARDLINEVTGTISGPDVTINVSNNLTNLNKIVSTNTLNIVAANGVINSGTISTNGALTLKSATYTANSAAAMLSAANAHVIVTGALLNSGSILGGTALDLTAGSIANNDPKAQIGGGVANITTTSGDLTNAGLVAGSNGLTLSVAGNLINSGNISSSAGNLNATATGGVSNSGLITASGDTTIDAASFSNNSTASQLGGANVTLALTGDFSNSGLVSGTSSLNLTAKDLTNSASGQNASGAYYGLITAPTVSIALTGNLANTGIINSTNASGSTDDLKISGATLTNSGQLASGTAATVTFSGAATNSGTIGAAGQLDLTVGSLQNSTASASITSGTIANLIVTGGDLSNAGQIGGVSAASLKVAGNITNSGTIESQKGNLTVNASGSITSTGTLYASSDLTLTAVSLSNAAIGAQIGGNTITITLPGDFSNLGSVSATKALQIGANNISNGSSGTIAGDTVVLKGAGNVTSDGTINSTGTTVTVSGANLTNNGKINAQTDLTLTFTNAVNNNGTLGANGTNAINAASYTGGAGASVNGNEVKLALSGDFNNAGAITAGDTFTLNAANATNTATGNIQATNINSTLSGALTNAGMIATTGLLQLHAAGAINNSGTMTSKDTLIIVGNSDISNSGTLHANNFLYVTGNNVTNTSSGKLDGGSIEADATGALNNAGTIVATNDLTINAASLTNSGPSPSQIAVLSGDTVELYISGALQNGTNALIQANTSATVQAGTVNPGFFTNTTTAQGLFNYGQNLSVTLTQSGYTFTAPLIVAGNLYFSASGDIVNLSTIAAGGDLTLISTGGSISNGVAASSGTAGGNGLQLVPTDPAAYAASLTGGPAYTGDFYVVANGVALDLTTVTSTVSCHSGQNGGCSDPAYVGGTVAASTQADGSVRVGGGGFARGTPGSVASSTMSGGFIIPASGSTGSAGTINAASPQIYSGGNMNLSAAVDITNNSAVIQSGGTLNISAGRDFINQSAAASNNATYTQSTTTTAAVTQTGNGQNQCGGCKPATYTTTETFASTSAPGAGIVNSLGDMNIVTGHSVQNLSSAVVSGGNLIVSTGIYVNAAGQNESYKNVISCCGSSGTDAPVSTGWYGTTSPGAGSSIYAAGLYKVTASVSAIDTGSDISGTEVIQAPNIQIGTTNPNLFTPQGRVPGGSVNLGFFIGANSPSVLGTGIAGHSTLSGSLSAALPAPNPRSVTVTNPNGTTTNVTYLYNTPVPVAGARDPDWVFQQTGQDARNVTFLESGGEEALTLEKAALAATGSTILDPRYTNPQQQDQALQQAAVDYANATGAQLGVDLTPAQKAAVTKPMLWYVSQNVDGQNVMVPELILPPGFTAQPTGGSISTNELLLTGDHVTNTGTINASGGMVVVANTFTNEAFPHGADPHASDPADAIGAGLPAYAGVKLVGGTINAGNLVINASGDVANALGTIHATNISVSGDNIANTGSLVASNNLQINATGTFVDEQQTLNVNGDQVSGDLLLHGGVISAGGNLSITSGGNLDIVGGTVSAGGDAALVSLGGDVNIIAKQVSQTDKDYDASGKITTTSNTLNVGSTVSAGGSLGVASLSGSVTLQSSTLNGTNIGLYAAQDVNFLAGIDTRQTTVTGTADNGITETIYNQGTINQNVVYDKINGNLTINAAGINMDYLATTNNSTMGDNGQLQLVSSSTQTPAQAIAALAGQPGYGWMNQVAHGSIPVSYNGLTIDNASWNKTQTTVDPVVGAFIALVTSMIMPGALGMIGLTQAAVGGVVGSTLAPAVTAGIDAFASGLVSGTINGAIGGNLDMGSVLENALAGGLSAGLTGYLNPNFFGSAANFALGPGNGVVNILQNGISAITLLQTAEEIGVDSLIQAGLSSALTGSDFGKSLEADLGTNFVNDFAEPVGFNITGDLGLSLPANAIAHAIVGAIGGYIVNGTVGAEAGAIGGALGVLADAATGVTPGQMPTQFQQDIAQLIGGLASLAVGDASMAGAMAALNGLLYNESDHPTYYTLNPKLADVGVNAVGGITDRDFESIVSKHGPNSNRTGDNSVFDPYFVSDAETFARTIIMPATSGGYNGDVSQARWGQGQIYIDTNLGVQVGTSNGVPTDTVRIVLQPAPFLGFFGVYQVRGAYPIPNK